MTDDSSHQKQKTPMNQNSIDNNDVANARSVLNQHLHLLFPEPNDQRLIMDWMAFCVQNPEKRIRWALLVHGAEGCGKTFLYSMLSTALDYGESVLINFQDAVSKRNDWADGHRLVAFEETVSTSIKSQYEFLGAVKDVISNEHVMIKEKHKAYRVAPNKASVLMFSNFLHVLRATFGDRRYYAVKSVIQTKEQIKSLGDDYFDGLYRTFYQTPHAFVHILKNHTVHDDFSPDKAPRMG